MVDSCVQVIFAAVNAWLKSSQRIWDGVWVNRCVRECSVNCFEHTWVLGAVTLTLSVTDHGQREEGPTWRNWDFVEVWGTPQHYHPERCKYPLSTLTLSPWYMFVPHLRTMFLPLKDLSIQTLSPWDILISPFLICTLSHWRILKYCASQILYATN